MLKYIVAKAVNHNNLYVVFRSKDHAMVEGDPNLEPYTCLLGALSLVDFSDEVGVENLDLTSISDTKA